MTSSERQCLVSDSPFSLFGGMNITEICQYVVMLHESVRNYIVLV